MRRLHDLLHDEIERRRRVGQLARHELVNPAVACLDDARQEDTREDPRQLLVRRPS